jgi:hypothetical protein
LAYGLSCFFVFFDFIYLRLENRRLIIVLNEHFFLLFLNLKIHLYNSLFYIYIYYHFIIYVCILCLCNFSFEEIKIKKNKIVYVFLFLIIIMMIFSCLFKNNKKSKNICIYKLNYIGAKKRRKKSIQIRIGSNKMKLKRKSCLTNCTSIFFYFI